MSQIKIQIYKNDIQVSGLASQPLKNMSMIYRQILKVIYLLKVHKADAKPNDTITSDAQTLNHLLPDTNSNVRKSAK